jgi:hypothetical protein
VRDAFENRPGIKSVKLDYVSWAAEHGTVEGFGTFSPWSTARVRLVLD